MLTGPWGPARARAEAPALWDERHERAQALYEEALELYKASAYDEAASRLSESHHLRPIPETLFAWAQAVRLAGRCAEAVQLFERFIALAPPERQVEAARLAMRRCQERPREPEAAPSTPRASLSEPKRWYGDLAGHALTAAGVGGLAAGLSLIVSAHARAAEAEDAPSLGASEDLRRQAEVRWAWGLGLSLFGTAALSAGVFRYVTVARNAQDTMVTVGGAF